MNKFRSIVQDVLGIPFMVVAWMGGLLFLSFFALIDYIIGD